MIKKSRTKLLLVLVVVALLLVGVFISNSYLQLRSDKSKFSLLDQDVSLLITVITTKDPKLSAQIGKYCRHDTVEFGGGKLSCNIIADISPIDKSDIHNLESTINTAMFQANKFLPKTASPLDLDPSDPVTNIYVHTTTKTECIFRRSKVNQTSEANYQVKVSFSCSEYVKKAIYGQDIAFLL